MMMGAELTALVFACFVQFAAIAAAGYVMNRELGAAYNMSPRDGGVEGSPLLGRLRRAVSNGFEGLAVFAPAVLIVVVSGQTSTLTAIAAWIYVIARICYIPAYAFPKGGLRSLIWAIGSCATLVLLVSALL